MTYRFRGKIVTYTVLFLLSLIVFFPMYWIVRSSLLNLQEILEFPPIWFPNAFRIDNYTEVMERVDFGKYFVNTFIVIIPVLVGVGLTASLTAFGFARLEFPLKNLWFSLIIMTILLPSIVTLVPTYIGWSKLQLTNTYWPLIIPAFFGGGAFNIFLLRQFLMTIPKELDESAVIDGAGYFVGVWNDFLGQLVYLNDANKYTVSLGLSTLRGANNTPMNLLMAGTAIMVIPAVIVFLFGQRYFIEGIATTGIKG